MKRKTEKNRYIKLMAEHFTTGLWDFEGRSCNPSEVSGHSDTILRLEAWKNNFDKSDLFTGLSQEEKSLHLQEALDIGHLIKEEHPEWNIVIAHEGYFAGKTDKKGHLIVEARIFA